VETLKDLWLQVQSVFISNKKISLIIFALGVVAGALFL
jgi:hypothetical protein